jgi:hypothetical protein
MYMYIIYMYIVQYVLVFNNKGSKALYRLGSSATASY